MLTLLIGGLVAGATYGYAKLQKTSDGKAVAAAAAAGLAAAWMWPLALLGGAAYAGYRWFARKNGREVGGSGRKMLRP